MVFEIKQTWWHITDISYSKYPSKRFQQVMDIFTDSSSIPITFTKNFLGLKVIGRNTLNNEIAFIWDDDGSCIYLNLDLTLFPNVLSGENPDHIENFKHAKIELDYIIWDDDLTEFERGGFIYSFIDKYVSPKYISRIEKSGEIQPELFITTPKGWEISNEGKSITTTFLWVENNQAQMLKDPDPTLFVKSENSINSYNYLFEANDYNGPNSSGHKFIAMYLSKISNLMLILSIIFPLFLMVTSLILANLIIFNFLNKIPFNLSEGGYFAYLAIVITFVYTYLSYVKNDYKFPTHNFAIVSVLYTIIVIGFGLICKI